MNHRLMELGWDLMRFWVYQVRDDLDRTVDLVREWAQGGVAGARLRPKRPLPDPLEHDEKRAVIRSNGFVDDPRFEHAYDGGRGVSGRSQWNILPGSIARAALQVHPRGTPGAGMG